MSNYQSSIMYIIILFLNYNNTLGIRFSYMLFDQKKIISNNGT